MIKQHKPTDLTVNLFLTTSCNLGCEWCIAKDYMSECRIPELIGNEEISELEKRIKNDIPKQFNLLGGEPTLHPDILEIGRRLYEKGVQIGLSTNGIWNDSFRKKFDGYTLPIEIELTFLGWEKYSTHQRRKILQTFEQIKQKQRIVSIGAVIDSENFEANEHLNLAEHYGFEFRWSFPEPIQGIGRLFGYENTERIKVFGSRIYEIIKEANDRGIETWGDICSPFCAFTESQLEIFNGWNNDVSFICPPFFDVSPRLDIWRCLPLRPFAIKNLRAYNTFLEAYNSLKDYECKSNSGIFNECKECKKLGKYCGGGPRIAKDLL